jgi:murein L,D-transpeptidase YcbB/YkuD
MMLARLALVLMLLLPAAGAAAAPEGLAGARTPAAHLIAQRLAGGEQLVVGGRVLDAAPLRALYAGRGWLPLWHAAGAPTANALALRAALGGLDADALDPADYGLEAIDAALAGEGVEAAAASDILLSAGAMAAASDLRLGRERAKAIEFVIDFPRQPYDPAAAARALAGAPDVAAALAGQAPQRAEYQGLRAALPALRAEVAAIGELPPLVAGDSLRPGRTSDRTAIIRTLLIAAGDLDPALAGEGEVYDGEVVEAVKRFQARHGLTVDGIVGRNTAAALNVGPRERLGQVIATMERWRWVPDDLGPNHILVNVPAFSLDVIGDGVLQRRMRVIVGRPSRPTPLFSSRLTWLEFNPTWTVPTSIAEKDYLPKLIEDPSYLAAHGMRLYSGWHEGAVEMDALLVDWPSTGRGIRRFMLRQEPGPENALGKVKFMMANPYDIYLHDTPTQNLFARDDRAHSSGCIRVSEPLWLADYLLEGHRRWVGERRRAILEGWQTTRVGLDSHMPVHLIYTTAWVDETGALQFRGDLYGIDAAMNAALERRPIDIASIVDG